MRALHWRLDLLGTLALGGLPALTSAQPVGSEFQVNTYTTSNQVAFPVGAHLVAGDASGNFVVVWQSYAQDGSSWGIFGQRYDSAGGAQGGEFRANSYTTSWQQFPSIASDASGNFVVVWESYNQDGYGQGVFGQRYASGGGKLGGDFRVNSSTFFEQAAPSVASDVVWHSYWLAGVVFGVRGQRYDSEGGRLGTEFRVNSATRGYHYWPSVTSAPSGDFVVVWWGNGKDEPSGVFGQRYDAAGEPFRRAFRVNSYTTGAQRFPSVGAVGSGQFVVIWTSPDQDGDGDGMFGQRHEF